MNEKIETLYSMIANKALELIPTEWGKLWLYAEILPGVVTEFHYFLDVIEKTIVQFGDIPNRFHIDRNEFNFKSLELTKLIYQLNAEWVNSNHEEWTNMTLVVDSDGYFHIDYGYENLEETDISYRREQWENKYLKSILN